VRVVRKRTFLMRLFFVIAALCGLAVLIFLMRGETTVTGSYPDDVKDRTLTCEKSGLDYPFFSYPADNGEHTKVNVIFHVETLRTISLVQTLYYSNADSPRGSEAHNHAAMNTVFGKNGLSSDALGAKYARFDDKMTMSLFASADEFNSATAKFFLLSDSIPTSSDGFKKAYENLGFSCSVSQ